MLLRPVPDRLGLFRWGRSWLAVEATAADMIQLRIGSKLPPKSEVLSPPSAPSITAQTRAGVFELRTEQLSFRLTLATGAWSLRDQHRIELFWGPAGSWGRDGSGWRVQFALAETERWFGLGEGWGPLDQRGRVREFWNCDVLGVHGRMHAEARNLYVSIPFALSIRDGRAAGVFWDNSARQTWDIGAEIPDRATLRAAGGELRLFFYGGPTPAAVVGRFTEQTGRIPLPPRWALGYHQSRYSYRSAQELIAIAAEFRRRQLPCEALYLDIDALDGKRVFTFGPGFRRPKAWVAALARRGFRTVAIVDPGVKEDPQFGVFARGTARNAFVKMADGHHDAVGEVWPGRSRFPDFLRPEVRQWWGEEQAALARVGIAGVWNDMNEPALFDQPGKTLPETSVHHDGQRRWLHALAHNRYGSAMAQASREGFLAAAPGQRPFVITRAGNAGVQRQALVWTGDTASTWEHLAATVPMLLNLGLSGVPFCGADVGGFTGNATPELFLRWFQLAALTPFMRGHTDTNTRAHEPWAFGPTVEEGAREALRLRMQLMPYLVTLLAAARATGSPVIRPLLWHYPNDPVAVGVSDQFLLGRDLLVAPVLQPGVVARCVYLPNEVWYDFWTGAKLTGGRHVVAAAPLERIPVYVRAGAILPLISSAAHTGAQRWDTIQLHVWPHGRGELGWYEDDGATQAYEAGGWSARFIRNSTQGRTLRLEFAATTGERLSEVKVWQLQVWDAARAGRLRLNGRSAQGRFDPESNSFSALFANGVGPFGIEYTGV